MLDSSGLTTIFELINSKFIELLQYPIVQNTICVTQYAMRIQARAFCVSCRLSPGAPLSYINAAKMLTELGNRSEAEIYYRTARDLMQPPSSGNQLQYPIMSDMNLSTSLVSRCCFFLPFWHIFDHQILRGAIRFAVVMVTSCSSSHCIQVDRQLLWCYSSVVGWQFSSCHDLFAFIYVTSLCW